MSAGMPELGSKISLISKADIRYEGRLFTVDPQECTIALANVKSFGTEDRETQFPVVPQNQVYEYILFRGSDIKDIRVVNNVTSLPGSINDPAIVQMTVQPSMGQPAYQPQPGYGHPMMGQMGPIGSQYGPYMPMGGMGPMMGMGPAQNRPPIAKTPSELGLVPSEPSAIVIPNAQSAAANVDPLPKDQSLEDGVLDMISGGSRSTTPSSLLARKSPTMDQSVQTGQQQANNIGKIGDKQNLRNVQPHRDSHGSGRTSGMSQYSGDGKQPMQQHHPLHQQAQHRDGPMHGPGGQNMRNNRPNQGGWQQMNQRGGQMRGHRGTGGGSGGGGVGGGSGGGGQGQGGGQTGNARNARPNNFRNQQSGGLKPKNRLKFDKDYDFEQANTEFEELRSQLAKTKIDGVENEKKDDSGNETGAGDNEPEEDSEIVHYDKSKSFFDNISCEAVERSKGRSQRTDWRTERKLNSETFGVASMRRGGFRGRGYYGRGNNMGGGMYRNNQPGGGNQNYRGGYRNQRGGQHKNPNQFINATGSTSGIGNQSNRNQTIGNTANSAEQATNISTSATTSANNPSQQDSSRLVTGAA